MFDQILDHLSLIRVTFIGIIILAVLTIIIVLVAYPVLNVYNPPPPLCSEITELSNSQQTDCVKAGGLFPPNAFHNLSEFVWFFTISYVLSVWIISFFSGFYLSGLNYTVAWESFTSGFIIGVIGPALLVFSSSKLHIQEMIFLFIFGAISGLIGLAGYGVASWHRRHSTTST